MSNPYQWIEQSLKTIHQANWYRQVTSITSRPGAVIELENSSVINFASNDYLGLAGDERLSQAAIAAIAQYGTGSTGSRLLSGHRDLHRQLEQAISRLKQTEDALVFSSGYLANLGAIAALVSSRDLILADQYNHSSLKNGAKLSGATVFEYAHLEVKELQSQLQQYRHKYRRCLILSDSVFSMDGDVCPLKEMLSLAKDFEAMLLIDEAHATGVMGATGAGCVEYFDCRGEELVQVGTLSKALGSLGGYVAGSARLIDFLRNRAPTWIYTTALSPADTAAAIAAITLVTQEPQRREQLWRNVTYLKHQLSHLKWLPSQSPILCLSLATATEAVKLSASLKEARIFAPAIRPPTVPTSRLRFSLMATHTEDHLQQLIKGLTINYDCFVPRNITIHY